MTVNATQILEELKDSSEPFEQVTTFSLAPGVYAVFLFASDLPLGRKGQSARPGALIYIGKTQSSQIQRDVREHFQSGRTGQSTLRRSIGALLREELCLVPVPRSRTEASERRYEKYKFTLSGEEKLTNWMRRNLGLSFHECREGADGLRQIEADLIRLAIPVLNLTNNPSNGHAEGIKVARAQCARLARRH